MVDRLIAADTPLRALEALRGQLEIRAGVGADSRTALEAVEEIIRLRRRIGEGIAAGHKRVTLCGSQRFREQFDNWHWRLMVVDGAMVHTAPNVGDARAMSTAEKEAIDMLWFAMIEQSDEVFVIDATAPGGERYIGDSTYEEIAFARERDIPVRYLSEEKDDG